jgi:hypothetical protein
MTWEDLWSIVFACLLLFSPSIAAAEDRKAQTVDELAKMYDVSSCKECHKEVYEQWEKSLHARSILGTGRTAAGMGGMIKNYFLGGQWKYAGVKQMSDLTTEHMMQCMECHLPQLKNATNAVAQELAQAVMSGDTKTLDKLSINCLVCHNMKAILHQWVDGPPEAGVIYGNIDGKHEGVESHETLKKGPIMQESIMCGQCHGLGPGFHRENPTQCATLYGSYMHAYLPTGGSHTCQDCHMDKGHEMSTYRDPDMGKKAVNVQVDTLPYYFQPKPFDWDPVAVVTVKMTNNAGHRLPDG